MDVRELRMGNFVQNYYIKRPYRIDADGIKHCDELNKMTEFQNSSYTPIPLTEEWLIDFGFKEVKPKEGVLMAFKKDSIRIEISHSGNFYYKNKSLPYVHLLQNVYYFNELTGEELTLKNKENEKL